MNLEPSRSSGPQTTVFDLSEARSAGMRMNRGIVIALTAAGLVVLSGGVYLILFAIWRDSANGGPGVGVILTVLATGAFTILAGLSSILAATKKLPGAERLLVSDQGVELRNGSVRIRTWTWKSPKDRFVLTDCSRSPSAGVNDNPLYFISADKPFSRGNPIPKIAFDTLLSAARESGAQVIQSYGSPRAYYPTTFYKVIGRTRIDG